MPAPINWACQLTYHKFLIFPSNHGSFPWSWLFLFWKFVTLSYFMHFFPSFGVRFWFTRYDWSLWVFISFRLPFLFLNHRGRVWFNQWCYQMWRFVFGWAWFSFLGCCSWSSVHQPVDWFLFKFDIVRHLKLFVVIQACLLWSFLLFPKTFPRLWFFTRWLWLRELFVFKCLFEWSE